jgi:hypothetical protein
MLTLRDHGFSSSRNVGLKVGFTFLTRVWKSSNRVVFYSDVNRCEHCVGRVSFNKQEYLYIISKIKEAPSATGKNV